MKKIKRLLCVFLLGFCVSTISAKGADIVVLMDSSGTILPWFDEINNRVLVDITRKFVREGDTFHLISFNSRVNLEIAQPVESEADIARIVSRFMLLYPLGQNSDFLSGLQYVWQYVSALEQQRDKIVIVISDGIFNPPQSSPYVSYTNDQIRSELTQVSRKIRGAGWNVYYIKLPFPQDAVIRSLDGNLLSGTSAGSNGSAQTSDGTASEGTTTNGTTKEYLDISSEFSSDLDIPRSDLPADGIPITFIDQVLSIPEVTFPTDLGKKGRLFVLPIKVKNTSDASLNMELTGVYIDDETNVLSENSFLKVWPHSKGVLRARINLPDEIPYGPHTINFRLGFSDNLRVSPQSAEISVVLTPLSLGTVFRTGSSVIFTIIVIIIAIALVLFLVLFISHRTERPVADTIRNAAASVTRKDEDEKETNRTTATGERLSASTIVASAQSVSSGKSTASGNDMQRSVLSETAEERAARTSRSSTSDYAVEKKQYASANSVAQSDKSTAELASLSESIQAERTERFALLSKAAVSENHMGEKRKGASAGEKIEIKGSDRMLLELVVDGQNSHIGKRNVHMMGAGTRLSVGGGNSAFLVFLVRFPARIAEIRFDGKQCFLAILKPEYFPYEQDTVIPFEIGRSFTIISDKEHAVTFGFKVYEDPVLKLNTLLQSIM